MSRPASGPMGLALALALLSLMLLGCANTPRHEAVSAPVEGLPVGSGAFLADVNGRQIEVFTYRATNHAPDSPVILVLAGGGRNGDDYRDAWIAFGKVKYPQVAPNAWRAWFTRKRIAMLEGLHEQLR